MRRATYVERPRCTHHEAIWADYEARCDEAREAFPYSYQSGAPSGERKPWPESPKDADGYCDACRAELSRPGAVWPADVWAYLDSVAARDLRSKLIVSKPYKLPPAPKERREPIDKWHARALKAYGIDKALGPSDVAKIEPQLGRPTGSGFYLETCNGHCALLVRGEAPKTDRCSMRLSDGYGAHWIDLPAAFYLALQRVRLLANARSEAVRLTSYANGTVHLYARSVEYGEAWETVTPVKTSGAELPEYETCLNASYLDAALGVWPVRWYLRPPVTWERAASRYERGDEDGRVHGEDEQPQIFGIGGDQYRVAIMPMRT